MAAELAKPDSMGDLDQADEEAEEEETEGNMEQVEESEPCAEQDKEAEQEQEAEERMSLLTEEQKEKSSPSIQLVAGPVQPPVSSGSGANIKVDIEQGPSPRSGVKRYDGEVININKVCVRVSQYSGGGCDPRVRDGGCYSVCGPSPLKVSVICLLVISFWILLVLIMHLDKKVTNVQMSLDSTEDLLETMKDSAAAFR